MNSNLRFQNSILNGEKCFRFASTLIILLLIFFIPSTSFSQSAQFLDILKKPNPKLCNDTAFSIKCPIIITDNSEVDSIINERIREYWEGDPDSIAYFLHLPTTTLMDSIINDGLCSFSYDVNYNSNGLLSLSLYGKFVPDNPKHYYEPFGEKLNFDLATGKLLRLYDIIKEDQLEALTLKTSKDKTKSMKNYERTLANQLKYNSITRTEFDKALHLLHSACLFYHGSYVPSIDDFILFPKTIELFDSDQCNYELSKFPNQPKYSLMYSYKEVKSMLTDYFKNKMLIKSSSNIKSE